MSDELRIILATLGTISTLVLIPIIGLLFKWSVLLQKIAQTVYGENGNNDEERHHLDPNTDGIARGQPGWSADSISLSPPWFVWPLGPSRPAQ